MREGIIDIVVSDHSPSTVDLKCLDAGDFGEAWGGISSLDLGVSTVWTGAHPRVHAVRCAWWMCQGAATLTGMRRRCRIDISCDAGLCVFASDDTFLVDVAKLHHQNALTHYHGRPLAGVVRSTRLHGVRIDIDAEPRCRLLRRGES